MIFVDTSAWFARYSPEDVRHGAAKQFLAMTREKLVTSDYVVDEVLTLLKVRENVDRAAYVGETLFSGKAARIE